MSSFEQQLAMLQQPIQTENPELKYVESTLQQEHMKRLMLR